MGFISKLLPSRRYTHLIASLIIFIGISSISQFASAIDPVDANKLSVRVSNSILNNSTTNEKIKSINEWEKLPSLVTLQGILVSALKHARISIDPQYALVEHAVSVASRMIAPNSISLFSSYINQIIIELEKKLDDSEGDKQKFNELKNSFETIISENASLLFSENDIVVATLEVIERLMNEDREFEPEFNLDELHIFTEDSLNPASDVQIEDESEQIEQELRLAMSPSERFQNGLEKIEKMRISLERDIIGQPEVIEALLDIEYLELIYGQSHPKGVTLKLMGLPGVGKDTTAMAWVNAKHESDEAFVDHMLRLPVIKNKSDIAKLIGSPAGYVGSNDVPVLVKFLAEHSGGKYLFKMRKNARSGEKPWFVALNPDWRGENLPGFSTADEGVVFLNEIHNWSKEGRDAIKTFVEEGRLEIANPGTGADGLVAVNELVVPIRRIEASNELISQIATNRRLDGTYVGTPQTFDELLENWRRNHSNYSELRKQIIAEGSAKSSSGAGDDSSFGTSQEALNRIKDQHLLLMRPLSPADIQRIIRIKLSTLVKRLIRSPNGFSDLTWEFSDSLVQFIQEWNYNAEEGARSSEGRIESLLELVIVQSIKEGYILPGEADHIDIDIKRNEDGTYNLHFKKFEGEDFELLIPISETAKYQKPIDQDELAEAYSLGDRLAQHVFGISRLVKRIGDQIASRLVGRDPKVDIRTVTKSAQVYMFLGLSSTGKTELSKAISREVYGDEKRMLTIPFGEIKTAGALQEWITGSIVAGKVKKSKLMEIWDETNGNFVLNLDELSNAPMEIQEGLYDLLREKTYSNFSDREPRVTENLIITITGNAGEDWFTQIPRSAPIAEQQAAMYEVYRRSVSDSSFMREELEKHFKKALINRVGMANIFFFPPLSYTAIRQLTQSRLLKSIESLSQKRDSREPGWDAQFLDAKEFEAIVKILETDGFELFEQGASLVRFVEMDFERGLRVLLGRNEVSPGSKVTLYIKTITEERREGLETLPGQTIIGVLTEDGRDLELVLNRRKDPKEIAIPTYERIFTAFHEAGHEIVRKVLLGDMYNSSFISIIPGVSRIGGRWLRYLGVASSEKHTSVEPTKQNIIAELAVLAAGEIAEDIVAKGGRSIGGKQNDMTRSTSLARRAILCLGLSQKFGVMSCPFGNTDEDLNKWISGEFSDDQKKLLSKEVESWLQEARDLARLVLVGNLGLLEEMAVKLAEQGRVESNELDELYSEYDGNIRHPRDITTLTKIKSFSWGRFFTRFSHLWFQGKYDRPEFVPGIEIPKSIANISEVVRTKKSLELMSVELPENIPLATNSDGLRSRVELSETSERLPKVYQYGSCLDALKK